MTLARQTSWIWRLNLHALWVMIATLSLFAGLHLRDWTWKQTAPIRFRGDIGNALNIGRETVLSATTFKPGTPLTFPGWPAVWRAYLNRYDADYQRAEASGLGGLGEGRYRIDYPPGRLLIASAWAKSIVSGAEPGATHPRGMGVMYSDEYAAPLRWTNTGHEIAAALAMFFFVRRILLNAGRRYWVSELLALFAALLLWFNPALIMDAHGWPQWESWVLPYTLWAAYAALIDRWLVAGALIAVGAMLKGQVLMFAPLFPLWAIFSLRFGGFLRLASGFFGTVAVLMWPWLVRDAYPGVWVLAGTVAFAAYIAVMKSRRSWLAPAVAAGVVGVACAPALGTPQGSIPYIAAGAAAVVVVSTYALWKSKRAAILAFLVVVAFACAALLPGAITAVLHHQSPAWLSVAFPAWTYVAPPRVDWFVPKLAIGFACAIAAFALMSRRGAVAATVGFFAVLTILAAINYEGSIAWLKVGFQTARYDQMSMGRVCNLPAILKKSFDLNVDSPLFELRHLPGPILVSQLLKAAAGVGLALCALAMAIQVRRRDANAVIPLAAAWTLLYAILPQMHERYLVWGSALSAVMIVRGVAGLLLHLTLTALQFSMLLFAMCSSNGRGENIDALRPWLDVFAGLHPESGYIVLTLAIVLLCWSFRSSRREAVAKRAHATPHVLLKSSIRVAETKQPRPVLVQ